MDRPNLHGEFICRLDAKGRVKMPSILLRQLGGSGPHTFFVNRGFEKCLMIYPEKVWEQNLERIKQLNVYRVEERNFIRYFFRGVSNLTTDSAERILINKSLLEYIGADREVILFAYLDRIELWDKKSYEAILSEEPSDFAQLAERVLGSTEIS